MNAEEREAIASYMLRQPYFGGLPLRDISPETIEKTKAEFHAQWPAARPPNILSWLKARAKKLYALQYEQARDAEKACISNDGALRSRSEELMNESRRNWETARALRITIDEIKKGGW